jgi:hypothetical protein
MGITKRKRGKKELGAEGIEPLASARVIPRAYLGYSEIHSVETPSKTQSHCRH